MNDQQKSQQSTIERLTEQRDRLLGHLKMAALAADEFWHEHYPDCIDSITKLIAEMEAICTCGDVNFGKLNELADETTRLREQLDIAVHKLELLEAQHTGQAGSTKLSDCMAIMAKQALAQIRELEK